MCSFYDADGTMILACSGHLRFAAATSDAIRRMIEWFDADPGIHEGDEFIINDPYVAGSHTYDFMQIAPVFHEGRRVAWVASSSHTADTGGVLRGAATEIFHEGIRLLGLKIVERGVFRQDVFKTIVEQCRDPHYVGMDIKSRTAANTVCARGYASLIEQFGIEFVEAAGREADRRCRGDGPPQAGLDPRRHRGGAGSTARPAATPPGARSRTRSCARRPSRATS